MNPLEGGGRAGSHTAQTARTARIRRAAGGGLAFRMPEDSRPPPAAGSGLMIREARSTDIDALARLEAERFASDRLSRRSLARAVEKPLRRHAGREPRRSAARLRGAPHAPRQPERAALFDRRRGRSKPAAASGRACSSAAEDAARRRGARPPAPGGARRQSERDRASTNGSGYRPIGRRPGYYEDGMTALLFARQLALRRAAPPPRRLSRAA